MRLLAALLLLVPSLAWSAPTFVSAQSATSTWTVAPSGASVSTTVASIANGAVVVAFVGSENLSTITGVTSANLTFTQRASLTITAAAQGIRCYTAVAGSALTNEVLTASNSNTNSRATMISVQVWTGVNTSALTNTATAQDSATQPASVTITRAGSDSHVAVGAYLNANVGPLAASTDTTEASDIADTSRNHFLWSGYSTTAGTGSITLNANTTGSIHNQPIVLAAIELEAAGGDPPACVDHSMLGVTGCF